MPIKVSCKCGQSFTAKDELRGQTLLCPKCTQPLTIGANQEHASAQKSNGMAGLFDEAGLTEQSGPSCPSCNTPLPGNAVVCVLCGYNLETGEQITGAKVVTAETGGHQAAADDLLDRAAQQIETDKVEMKKNTSHGAPAWTYFVSLAIVCAFVAMMFTMPRDQAFNYSGLMLMGFGSLIQTICVILILIVAFKESTTQGILSLLIPLYVLIFACIRWAQCGGYFTRWMVGFGVLLLGLGMVAISPLFASSESETKPEPDDEGRLRRPPAVRVVAVPEQRITDHI